MAHKIYLFIDSTLNTRITPLAYLLALHSWVFGAAFVFFTSHPSVKATLLYQYGALIGVPVWGVLLFASATALLLGMYFKKKSLVGPAGLGAFMSWLFAAILYFQNDLVLQGILAGILTLCFGYYTLASNLDRLWDYTP